MRTQLDNLLKAAVAKLAERPGREGIAAFDPRIERTKDARHGDFTTNIAMQGAKSLGTPPRTLAAELIECVPESPLLAKVEIAGPGFVNFTMAPSAYRDELRRIVRDGEQYGRSTIGTGTRVLVEYVSANPTGPLHVGHGRGAAYGATLANVLRAAGYDVEQEYYINDAGRQMDILAASVWIRYAQLCGHDAAFPPNAYQGGYIREIAEGLRREQGDALLGDPQPVLDVLASSDEDGERRLDRVIETIRRSAGPNGFRAALDAALDSVLGDIRDDLAEFGVVYDRWFSERSLTDSGAVDRAIERLEASGALYEKEGAKWFRSTDFGDDKDRVVVRENGARTYFASDVAYHLDKRERRYDLLLNVLGADHHGYVARVRAALAALDARPESLEVRLVQFVVLYRGAEKAQMSTRSGEYVTLRELRNEVGNDAARFFYVSRSNEQHLEFDLELAKSQSNDNPVYYVQYAHARVESMLRRLADEGHALPQVETIDLDSLVEPEEQTLIAALSRYPEVVELAAEHRAPQHIVHYVREVAASFHTSYNAHRVLVEDAALRDARVALALAARQVIRNALGLLGVAAPSSM